MRFFLAGCALLLLATSCTTLSNRRDLYNPSEDAGPYNSLPPAHPNASPTPTAEPLQPAPQ
ncbi:MAG TPA: hypothetical protein VGG02_13315 [Chthoniobacterales bacterium]|jgi:hypothetical protein